MDAIINYAARTDFRQRYYANDHSRDTVVIESHTVPMMDGRTVTTDLDEAGFALVRHNSSVADFTDTAAVARVHSDEIAALVKANCGADKVLITGPAILRFSETSQLAGALNNSMPARFAHVDITSETAAGFVARAARDAPAQRTPARYAHFNVWRSFSGAPQDVPLAVCDARSVEALDLMIADALFDEAGKPDWGFESWIVAHNAAHRWHWFPDMAPDEALIFKTSDSLHHNPVPHVAFDNPLAPAGCHPRASIEMRAVALWF